MKVYYYFHKLARHSFWFIILPLVVLAAALPVSLPVFYQLEKSFGVSAQVIEYNKSQPTFDSLPSSSMVFSKPQMHTSGLVLGDTDYRAIVLDEYFKRNDSPLYGYGEEFVRACKKYKAPYDCTTLPAIAYVETRLCTLDLSHAQRNCWGFGGSGPNRIWFKDYKDAIDLITDRLVNAYGPSYMTNPESMQHTYCGPHCNVWGPAVQQMRYSINNLAIEMGYPPLIR